MAVVKLVETALPSYRYSKDDIIEIAKPWLGEESDNFKLFSKFVSSSNIQERSFALPLEEILQQEGSAARAATFEKAGVALGKELLSSLFTRGVSAQDVHNLVFVSCSMPTIPSLDARLISLPDFEFSPHIGRVPIYQYGCAGGAAGLSLAAKLVGDKGPTLLLSVELCSLVYQGDDLTRGNLVGSALFGDGAAGVIIDKAEGPLEILDTSSYLIPNSTEMMGYDIHDDGTHLRLKRELPAVLSQQVPELVQNFLARNQLKTGDIQWWLFHPGGTRILEGLEQIFELRSDQDRFAWNVLAQHGNMSSASVLFVLDDFLRSGAYSKGDKVLMLGIGPGLTVELVLFECLA